MLSEFFKSGQSTDDKSILFTTNIAHIAVTLQGGDCAIREFFPLLNINVSAAGNKSSFFLNMAIRRLR